MIVVEFNGIKSSRNVCFCFGAEIAVGQNFLEFNNNPFNQVTEIQLCACIGEAIYSEKDLE